MRGPISAALLVALAGCAQPRPTAIDVKATFGSDVQIDQLQFEVLDGAQMLFMPDTLPSKPAGLMASGQGVAILLDDGVAGIPLTVEVTGLRASMALFHGAAMAIPIAQATLAVPVALGAEANEPPTSITVAPATVSAAAGATPALAATGHFADGSARDVSATATWQSNDSLVASVAPGGLVTAQKPGGAIITASIGGVSGSATVTVTDALLQSIEVTPATASITLLGSQQFEAYGHYSDGSRQLITSQASWKSSAMATATINSAGLASAITPGSTTITAGFDGMTGTAALTVQ